MKVFLGGTVNKSKWRDYVMERLKVDYFNPVVEEWNEEAYVQELYEREHCEYCLYVLTPRMEGLYSIAEVIDDSYKKNDRTVYCYLQKDDDRVWTEEQEAELLHVGRKVTENGGLWLKSLDEVVAFFNSSLSIQGSTPQDEYNHVFISYGRRHSLAFARKLNNRLRGDGYKVWFDMNNIPLGVDFQEQIDEGIKKADSFIYVISPHSIKSVYCLKEVVLAIKYNKRIIPLLHIEPTDCWDQMHPVISRLNWIYFREKENFSEPLENWDDIDDFEHSFSGLSSLLKTHQDYIRQHTVLLDKAIDWDLNARSSNLILVGKERQLAEQWLLTKQFYNGQGSEVQSPCLPTDIHAELIAESKKNAENLMTNVFIAYDKEDADVKELLRLTLAKECMTSWTDSTDIKKGTKYKTAIQYGIEEADNFLFLISPRSVNSAFCLEELDHALSLNKRIIPLLIEDTDEKQIPLKLRMVQYIDFRNRTDSVVVEVKNHEDVVADVTARKGKTPFRKSADELVNELSRDRRYYEQHKVFLVQALKWKRQKSNPSMLLRGYNLENAKAWLNLAEKSVHPPIAVHKEFVQVSEANIGELEMEVFVSYSRTDGDFARKLNTELQIQGKTTWFDQESIASGTDFQHEIYKGIEQSNNFLFIISPDAINSPYCADEVEYAQKHHKRIITILHRKTDPTILPIALAAVQWIDFTGKDFHSPFIELIRTLDVDREHIQIHTRWLRLALEWEKFGKPDDLLLRGVEFKAASEWMEKAIEAKKKPSPTDLQIDFIKNSKRAIEAALMRERTRKVIMVLMWVVILGLFALAFLSYKTYQSSQIADFEKEKSDSLRGVAESAFKEAEVLRIIAEASADTAYVEKERAEAQKDSVLLMKQAVERSAQLAWLAKQRAENLAKKADSSANVADSVAQIALQAKAATDSINLRSVFNLYVFNSANFATKSRAVTDSDTMKALLAMTAYALQDTARKIAEAKGYPMVFEPSVLESLQDAALKFHSNSIYSDEIWAINSSADHLMFADNAGKLIIQDLKVSSSSLVPETSTVSVFQNKGFMFASSLMISPDGRQIIHDSQQGVKAYSINNGSITPTSLLMSDINPGSVPAGFCYSANYDTLLVFYHDNSILGSDGETIKFLFSDNLTEIRSVKMPMQFYRPQVLNTTQMLAIDNDNRLVEWNMTDKSKAALKQVYGYPKGVGAFAINKQLGIVIAGGFDGTIVGYKLTNGSLKLQTPKTLPKKHKGIVSGISFSNDGKWMVTSSLDGSVFLWNLSELQDKEMDQLSPVVVPTSGNKVVSAAFSPDGNFVLWSDNSALHAMPTQIEMLQEVLKEELSGMELDEDVWMYYKRGDVSKPLINTPEDN